MSEGIRIHFNVSLCEVLFLELSVPNEGKVTSVDIRPTKATTLFSDQKIREMIVELHGIFSECHEGLKTTGKLDNNEYVCSFDILNCFRSLYLSQKYRSVLRSVANINDPNDLHMRDATLWAIYECMFLKTGGTCLIKPYSIS